jgi:hypothetical protein
VPAAPAAKPSKQTYAVSLDARPNPVVFTKTTTLSGRLTGPTTSGVQVRLEQDTTLPLGDSFKPTGMATTTAANGTYSFLVKPTVNTQYRAVAKTTPDTTSPARFVGVRPLISLRLSDATPRAGARVRFHGSVYPAHDGSVVRIQRRSATGRWVTVARTTLRDAGDARSTYSRRVRVRRDGVYRVKLPAHADHVSGFSRARTIRVH